jgi:hypothetical protein
MEATRLTSSHRVSRKKNDFIKRLESSRVGSPKEDGPVVVGKEIKLYPIHSNIHSPPPLELLSIEVSANPGEVTTRQSQGTLNVKGKHTSFNNSVNLDNSGLPSSSNFTILKPYLEKARIVRKMADKVTGVNNSVLAPRATQASEMTLVER